MTNYGFHQAMAAVGVEVATVKVGDRHVAEELQRRGWVLGGEQSGHVIDVRFTPSGDGIAAALGLLEALGGGDLSQAKAMTKLPQCLENVAVADPDSLETASAVRDAIVAESAALEGRGRVVVRPSGTEPVVRIMVEAPERSECEAISARLAKVVERELGGAP
jgi:phosphoglucosamine mutase